MALFDKPISKITSKSFEKPNFTVAENNEVRLSQLNYEALPTKTKVNGRLKKVTLKTSSKSAAQWFEMEFMVFNADNKQTIEALVPTMLKAGDNAYFPVKYRIFTKNKNGEDLLTYGVNNAAIVASILSTSVENYESKVKENQYGAKEILLDTKNWNDLPLLELTLGQEKDHPRIKNPQAEQFDTLDNYYFTFNNVRAVTLVNGRKHFGNEQEINEIYFTLAELAKYVSNRTDIAYGFNESIATNKWLQVENSIQVNNANRQQHMPSNQFVTPSAISNGFSSTVQTNFGNNDNKKMPF